MQRLIVAGLIALAVFAWPAVCMAQAAAAGNIPPVDQSTPRGALKVLTLNLDRGDAEAIAATLLAESPVQRKYASAMTEFAAAMARLRQQAQATYGAEGARALVGDTALATELAMAQIDLLTEELDEETAVVRSPNPDEPPTMLRKVEGKWRVPITAIVGDAPPDALTRAADSMDRQRGVIDAIREEIAAGKFKTPESAGEAMHRRQLEARMNIPADAPATAPATQPGSG